MAKAGSGKGKKPDDKKLKKSHPTSRADSTDTAVCIEKQLYNEIATSVQHSTSRVENEDASKSAAGAASGTHRTNNNNNSIGRTRASRNNITTESAKSRGTNRVYGKGNNNGVSPFILTNRRDNPLPRQHHNRINNDVSKNGITTFSRFNASTASIRPVNCNADEMGVKMHHHGHTQNSTRRRSPSLSPSGRKSSFRVRKPSRGSPATERQRQSKFIEEKMRDKASKAPPPQFLGEDVTRGSQKKSGKRRGALDTGSGHEDEMSSPTKKNWDLRKMVSSLFARKNAGSDESRGPSRTTSPVKQLELMDDRKAMAEREYAKLKARGYKGTIKRNQNDISSAAVPVTPASVDSSVSASPSKMQPRGLTSSKSLFDLAGIKRGSGASAYHQKLLKKRSNLQEKLAKLDKELAGMEPEDNENSYDGLAEVLEDNDNGDDDNDEALPVIPPGPSRVQHTKRGRHPRHVYAPRPLPTIPSGHVLNEMAEEDDEDEPAAATTRRDIIDKALPPPPCSTLKASLTGQQKRPNRKVTCNPNRNISEPRKRKGAMTIDEEPEFNEDEYLHAFRTWDNDQDSDYLNRDGPATSDTNADLPPSECRRHLPSRRAKQAKTTTENESQHRRIPPRRSSRGLRSRYSEDYSVSITPGEAGHEDVPPVPPVPKRLTRRATKMRKGKTRDVESEEKENEDPDDDDYPWPEGIF